VIRLKFEDGTEKMLDECEVTVAYTGEDGETVVRQISEVSKVMLIEPTMFVAPGLIGGMPVLGLAFVDASDLAIEVPIPCEFALDLAEKLPVDVLEAQRMARTTESGIEVTTKLPPRMDVPRKRRMH
jgi:hypothetical protein